jgi:hypothetical protein
MSELALPVRAHAGTLVRWGRGDGRVWLVAAAILAALAVADAGQARASAAFAVTNLAETAPYLLLSIALAAYAGATGADGLIARAFTGSAGVMIALAALAGGLSPFCSCGVIPLIAAVAVWALVKRPVFLLYIALSLTGAFAAGLTFQLAQVL